MSSVANEWEFQLESLKSQIGQLKLKMSGLKSTETALLEKIVAIESERVSKKWGSN